MFWLGLLVGVWSDFEPHWTASLRTDSGYALRSSGCPTSLWQLFRRSQESQTQRRTFL